MATLGSTRAASPYRERTSPFPAPLHSVTWVQLTVQKAIGPREPWRTKDKVRDTSTPEPKAPLPSSPRHLAVGGPQGRPQLPDHRCCCHSPSLQESGGRGAGWGGAGGGGVGQGELLTERRGAQTDRLTQRQSREGLPQSCPCRQLRGTGQLQEAMPPPTPGTSSPPAQSSLYSNLRQDPPHRLAGSVWPSA